MTPEYRLTINGKSFSETKRLVSIEIDDQRGMESDSCTIKLDDTDKKKRLEIPPDGAKITIYLGFKNEGKIKHGFYVVDHVSHDGPPDTLVIHGKAADMTKSFKQQKTRSWEHTTLQAVLSEVASDNGLKLAIPESLQGIELENLCQTNESDMNLCTRLAAKNHAYFKIIGDNLIFTVRNEGLSVSGQTLGSVTFIRNQGDTHQWDRPKRDQHDAVKAKWHDTAAGKTKAISTGSGTTRTLNETFPDEATAKRAANTAKKQADDVTETFRLYLAEAVPQALSESPASLNDWHPQIDGSDWTIDTVKTKLTVGESAGLKQDVKLDRSNV